MTITAPGKINLSLDIGPRRPDGFHDLESIVATFVPGDSVTVTRIDDGSPGVTLTCTDPTLPTDERNIAFRAAAMALERDRTLGPRVVVHLEKRLPHQAGLGGGSSDAAAVLLALDVAEPHRSEIAAALGSDVPLFLPRAPFVHMAGRGEIVRVVDLGLPALHGVVVRPDVGVSTGPAYALLDALPNRVPGRATERLLGHSVPLADALGNDFEAAILPAFPAVAAAHAAVRAAGALRALLCGSGSAVFGLARDAAHADALARALAAKFPFVSAVRTP